MSRAFEIVSGLVATGKSRQRIGTEIGYSRTAVSLFLSGTYGADLNNIESAILAAYDKRDCPHTGDPVAATVCRKKALAPKPFGGNARLDWWNTCQTCPHKPEVNL